MKNCVVFRTVFFVKTILLETIFYKKQHNNLGNKSSLIMVRIINNEDAFQVLAHSFSLSPSSEGYTLAYSANGTDFTNYSEAVPANETLIVNGIAKGMFFKAVGNGSELALTY